MTSRHGHSMKDPSTSSATIIELDAFKAREGIEIIETPDELDSSDASTTSLAGQSPSDEEHDALDFYIREEALFRQNIQLDLAHERQLMYRAALVILWIAALVLGRQWLLALI